MKRRIQQCPPAPPVPVPPNPTTPWLVYPHGYVGKPKSMKTQTFCSLNYNNFYIKTIPELQGKTAVLCSRGWLLLRDRYDRTHINTNFLLRNPVSFRTIYLSPVPQEFNRAIYSAILTCPPDADDENENGGCFILLFAQRLAAFCRIGDDSWVVQKTRFEGSDQSVSVSQVVCHNGVLYGSIYRVSLGNNIVVIEIVRDEEEEDNNDGSNTMRLSLRLLGRLDIPKFHNPSSKMISRMVESRGEVYAIHLIVDHDCRRVLMGLVWKLDLGRMAWVEVKTLKDNVFFSGNKYCISCPGAISGFDSGGLCFVLPKEKTVYFYRVEDASVTAMLPCPNLKTPWLDPFWVLPCYPRLVVGEEIEKHRDKKNGEENKPNKLKDDCQGHELLADGYDKESETISTILCKLPQHVISLIASHLVLFNYLSFRASCKEFRASAPPTQWRRTSSLKQKNQNSSSPPLLLHLNTYDHTKKDNVDPVLWNVMDPCHFNTHYPMSIPKSFVGAFIAFSNEGWLLTYNGKHTLQFLNPFTRESGSYPPYVNMGSVLSIGFSTSPTSLDCVTVGIYSIDDIFITYFKSGDSTWSVCSFNQNDEQEFSFEPSCNSPVYHDGAFYFLDTKGHLGVFELEGVEGGWRVFGKPVPTRSSSFHLAECDGNLVVVVIGKMGKWVEVFRWNHETEGWNKVKKLGDHTIFVGPYSCFSVEATRPQTGNRIYFPRLYCGGVVFYSMESRKWHSAGSDQTLSDFYGTRELLQCCWIEPSWSD